MKKLFLLLAMVGLMATACEGGLDNEENGGTPSAPKIGLSQQSIDVEFEPAQYSVSVTSPHSWQATSKNNWVIVDTEDGIAGTETLKFSVLRNEEEVERKGTIVVKNEDYNLITELYVIQKAFEPAITINPEVLNFTIEGGVQEIAIAANFEYEVSKNADWVKYTKTETGITVTVPDYVEVEERSADIVISNEKYGISKIVKVSQKAFVPEMTVESEILNFAFEGGSQDVAITANCEYTVSTAAGWISYTKTENGITIAVPNYVEVETRSADIIISSEKYNISRVVKVTQNGLSEEEYAKCCIIYTSSDGNIVTPYKTDVFGANIISNTYENGKGVILFNAPVTSIGDSAFYYCSLTSVTIPDSVTSIGISAFSYCKSLTSVTIPDSVTSIGKGAFYYCNGELIINSKTLVEKDYTSSNYPTYNSSGWLYGNRFTKLTIGDNITRIGEYAFYFFYSLISITIPDSVTSIGNYAFYNCGSLTSVTIPDSVTSIGDGAFAYCSSLQAFYGKYASSDNRYLVIDGVLNSFAPSGLTSYTIPDSVTSIGESAFSYCGSLTSVTIPDSVTSIGYMAFHVCTSLTSVYCKPITPPAGEYDMFNGNASGRKIYVPRNSVDAYKSAEYWSSYASNIVGYDF